MAWKPIASLLALCLSAGAVQAGSPVAAAPAGEGIAAAVHLVQTQAADHRLILLGELHGTREIPALVAALVAAYAEAGPVVLGLEVPHTEHAALRRYLESDVRPPARASLQAGGFWQVSGDQHDGRRSHDMLDLVEAVRRLRVAGRDVAVLPVDVRPDHGRDHHWRDVQMAEHVRIANAALPRGRLLVLTGNVHAMLRRPDYAPAQMQTSMGAHLRALAPYAVNIGAHGGQFWACTGQCGPLDVRPSALQGGPIPEHHGAPYHLQVQLPRLSVARLLGVD